MQVRTAVTKAGCKMADSGSVLFNFQRQGLLFVPADLSEEKARPCRCSNPTLLYLNLPYPALPYPVGHNTFSSQAHLGAQRLSKGIVCSPEDEGHPCCCSAGCRECLLPAGLDPASIYTFCLSRPARSKAGPSSCSPHLSVPGVASVMGMPQCRYLKQPWMRAQKTCRLQRPMKMWQAATRCPPAPDSSTAIECSGHIHTHGAVAFASL